MANRYDEAALAILRGEGILFPSHPDPADTGRLARPPGYALFLASLYAVCGRSFFVVQLVQNLLGALAAVLTMLVGRRLVGWRAGWVAAFVTAVSSHLAFASNLILPDALCPLPLLAALLLVIERRGESPGRALVRAGVAGALIGVATWLRPNLLLLAPFLALFVAAISDRWRAGLARTAVVIAGMVVVVAPITIRNWVVYHELVPVSINGGITLLHGVAEAGGRRFGVRSRDKLVIEEEATYYGDARLAEWWAAPDGIRRDRERYREALREMRAHPFVYARGMVWRMGAMIAYWKGGPPPVRWRADSPFLAAAQPRDDAQTGAFSHS